MNHGWFRRFCQRLHRRFDLSIDGQRLVVHLRLSLVDVVQEILTEEPFAFWQAAFFVPKNNRKYFGKISL